jgi:hypothetical protein
VETILDRKVTPMLPEATIPKPPATQPASPRPWVMTPLFGAPAGTGREAGRSRPPRRRAASASLRAGSRTNSRLPAGRAARGLVAVKTMPSIDVAGKTEPSKDTVDLLTVTAEHLRRALSRSFLRYNVAGDPDASVHAAMNVIEPVLKARDTEIRRLRGLISAKIPAG